MAKKEVKKKVVKKKIVKKQKGVHLQAPATIQTELNRIQGELKAPKNQFNKFGNYKYRNAEDILEGYKLVRGQTIINCTDDIVVKGDRLFLKATATLKLGDETEFSDGFAEIPVSQKGMNASQITGSASSYAKKYALNSLFAIDDVKDADFSKEDSKELDVMEEHEAKINMIDKEADLKEYWEAHKNDKLGKVFASMVLKRKNKIKKDNEIT